MVDNLHCEGDDENGCRCRITQAQMEKNPTFYLKDGKCNPDVGGCGHPLRVHPPGVVAVASGVQSHNTSVDSVSGDMLDASGDSTNTSANSIQEKTALFADFPHPKCYEEMTASKIRFTDTAMPFSGRESVLGELDEALATFDEPERLAAVSANKGNPILGIAATSGAGKSRLLHEIRSAYSKEKDYVVLVVTYNSLDSLEPVNEEKTSISQTTVGFLNRLVAGLLPRLDRRKLTNRFRSVDVESVTALIKSCFPQKKILILVDEVAHLGEEECINAAISVAGQVAYRISVENTAPCVSIVTALSERMMETARTASGRGIITIGLPLLSRDDTASLLAGKVAGDTSDKFRRAIDQVFAITAGHPRSLEWFAQCEWKNGFPASTTTLEGALQAIAKRTKSTLTEEVVKALLGGAPGDTDFSDLSRKAVVYRNVNNQWLVVPVFLYAWAAGSHQTVLGAHLQACLEAVWDGIFLKDGKQGETGAPLERLLRHYEAVRREVLGDDPMPIRRFLALNSEDVIPMKWRFPLSFPSIHSTSTLKNPPRNQWGKFATGTLNDSATLYYPGDSTNNFPRYDWFTVASTKEDKVVRIGGQCKHGHGKVQQPDLEILSIYYTTTSNPSAGWKKKGWIVLGQEALLNYLGPSIAAAAAPALFRPEENRDRSPEPSPDRKRARDSDVGEKQLSINTADEVKARAQRPKAAAKKTSAMKKSVEKGARATPGKQAKPAPQQQTKKQPKPAAKKQKK